MSVKASFRPSLTLLCNSGGNQEVVKSAIEVNCQKQMFTKKLTSDENLKLTEELRKQIMRLRDVLDLLHVEGTVSTPKLLTTTVEDLYKMYPEIVSKFPISDIMGASTKQGLAYLWTALISIGDSWTKSQEWRANIKSFIHDVREKIDSEKLVGDALQTIACIIKLAKMKFENMEVEENTWKGSKAVDIVLKKKPSGTGSGGSSGGSSPISPTSVLPVLPDKCNDEPPADKEVNLDLVEPVQGAYKKHSETLEVVGDRNDLTTLKLRVAKQWLGKSMSRRELSILASPVQPFKLPSMPLPQLSVPLSKVFELTSIDSTLSVQQAPESPNPLPQLVQLPSPTNTEVQCVSNGMPPLPPLPQASMIPPVLKGLPEPLPPPSNLGGPPPPPPMISSKGFSPPPPMMPANGAPLPPPPLLGGRNFSPRSASKLKRSSQMGNLYRLLKGKVEGSSLNGKSTQGRKSQVGSGTAGKQGIPDALAEITKRSAYFQQIEEDARMYAKTITELKSTITRFQTKDMTELVKFHKQVESHLENLTDESQVLVRFEGFPTKKLECLRMAAALYSKLDSIHTTIVNCKIVPPMNELLVKVDTYFTKITGEVDAIERTKDEELKRFKSHNIHFDFTILLKIKESMVDLSSGCMDLALKESKEAKSSSNRINNSLKKGSDKPAKLLWKAFQLAYRVYTFAGGQDDRAERLTRELAQEIETEPEI